MGRLSASTRRWAESGLQPHLPLTPPPQPSPATLAQALQHAQTTLRDRRPATHQPRSQPPWAGQLAPQIIPDQQRSPRTAPPKNGPFAGIFRNGASRTRTGDLLGAIQALSQLSYSPACSRRHASDGLRSVVGRACRRRTGLKLAGGRFGRSYIWTEPSTKMAI